MQNESMNRSLMMSIAAVERDTGLSKDTLRIWERRYGFPDPVRDPQGERCYPMEQIERLRLIKRLLDVGHRPGRVVDLPVADLQALAGHSADAQGLAGPAVRRSPTPPPLSHPMSPRTSDWVNEGLCCIDAHDVLGLRRMLAHALPTLGLSGFVSEVVSPLLDAVGEGWLRGRFQVPQEHWVSHCLQQSLHAAIHSLPLPHPRHAPRVLLSTFPGEPHSLGLLMVESWLAMQQALPINLGPQTPLWDLVHAAGHHQVDVVALSFSASAPATLVQDTLSELRAKLPAHIDLWAGGRNPLLQRRPPPGVVALDDMASVDRALQAWRDQHPQRGFTAAVVTQLQTS